MFNAILKEYYDIIISNETKYTLYSYFNHFKVYQLKFVIIFLTKFTNFPYLSGKYPFFINLKIC